MSAPSSEFHELDHRAVLGKGGYVQMCSKMEKIIMDASHSS